MVMPIFRSIYYGLALRDKDTIIHRCNPLLKLVGLVIYIAGVSLTKNLVLLLFASLIPYCELVLSKSYKEIIMLLRGIIIPIFFLTFISYLFYGLLWAVALVTRIILITVMVSIFSVTTTPSKLSQGLERLGVPIRYSMIPALTIRLIPLVAKDAQETIDSLVLRGEIKARYFIPKGIYKAIAILIASSLRRARYISEALATKFWGAYDSRSHLYQLKVTKYDIFSILLKGLFLAYVLITYL